MLQWEWLGGLPPLRRAAVIGAGSWGTAVAVMLARAGLEVDLGCRTREQADSLLELRRNERYLDGIELPENVNVAARRRARALAPRPRRLRRPVRAAARRGRRPRRRRSPRAAACSCAPRASCRRSARCPTAYVSERVPGWAVGALGGPAHAAAALNGGASLVLATRERAPSRARSATRSAPPASTSRPPPT